MTIIRTAFNIIYVLAFATSVAVAVKDMQKVQSNIPNSVSQVRQSQFHAGAEGRMIQHSLVSNR